MQLHTNTKYATVWKTTTQHNFIIHCNIFFITIKKNFISATCAHSIISVTLGAINVVAEKLA